MLILLIQICLFLFSVQAWAPSASAKFHRTSPEKYFSSAVADETFLLGSVTDDDPNLFEVWPSLAKLSDGSLVVVWSAAEQDSSDFLALYATVLYPNGNVKCEPFPISALVSLSKPEAINAVQGLPNGGFVVAWTRFSSSPGQNPPLSGQVLAQFFGQDCISTGPAQYLNEGLNTSHPTIAVTNETTLISMIGGQSYLFFNNGTLLKSLDLQYESNTYPQMATLNNGNIAYVASSPGSSIPADVRSYIYNSNGTPNTTMLSVENSNMVLNQGMASIVSLMNNNFLITWSGTNDLNTNFKIWGQLFNESGQPIGDNFAVSGSSLSNFAQYQPVASLLSTGGFVVVWMNLTAFTYKMGTGSIIGQIFNPDGTQSGSYFTIDELFFCPNFLAGLEGPHISIAATKDSGFMVVYESCNATSNSSKIYGRRYSAVGSVMDDPFVVNDGQFDPCPIYAMPGPCPVCPGPNPGPYPNPTPNHDVFMFVISAIFSFLLGIAVASFFSCRKRRRRTDSENLSIMINEMEHR